MEGPPRFAAVDGRADLADGRARRARPVEEHRSLPAAASSCARTGSPTSSTRGRPRPTASPASTTSDPLLQGPLPPLHVDARVCGSPAREAGTPTGSGGAGGGEVLKISGKRQIEEFGVARSMSSCRQSVERYIDEWEAMTESPRLLARHEAPLPHLRRDLHRVGVVEPQAALDRDLLYQGYIGRPYCPRCQNLLPPRALPGLPGRCR